MTHNNAADQALLHEMTHHRMRVIYAWVEINNHKLYYTFDYKPGF